VLADGKRVLACLSLAVAQQGLEITTIEGLADGDHLHPMQAAFMECDGFQCGYCTPGQIISAVALMKESGDAVPSHVTPDVLRAPTLAELSDEEIRERMSGNICRCGAYPNIVDAVKHAREVQPRSAHAVGKKEDGKKAGRK
jgi:xanthine dehydrogenase YagT iron-sulfur-binding subunit